VGRPSNGTTAGKEHTGVLRKELERKIENGRCAYCRAPALPHRPLTREHVIPRARGGRRKDVRIIVPACARCNQHRGSRDLVPFLLARPQRISSFLDHLGSLSAEGIRQMDLRVFAELYVAVVILKQYGSLESDWANDPGPDWVGRGLHRRRYAARRALTTLATRIPAAQECRAQADSPKRRPAHRRVDIVPLNPHETPEKVNSRLIDCLAVRWEVPPRFIESELARALRGTALAPGATILEEAGEGSLEKDLPDCFDGWRVRPRHRRLRVDRRHGRTMLTTRASGSRRGRAA
jgi:hypothetical protein